MIEIFDRQAALRATGNPSISGAIRAAIFRETVRPETRSVIATQNKVAPNPVYELDDTQPIPLYQGKRRRSRRRALYFAIGACLGSPTGCAVGFIVGPRIVRALGIW